MGTVYRYILRPAEDTGKLLIEFIDLPENKGFIAQLIQAFARINIQVVNYDDLWMHDEIALLADSDLGNFTFYRDAKDYYFITANDNPGIIPMLDDILSQSPNFMKLVNY